MQARYLKTAAALCAAVSFAALPVRAQDKISAAARRVAQSAQSVPVFILLKSQPHEQAVRNAENRHQFRLVTAHERLSRLAGDPRTPAQTLEQARSEVESVQAQIRSEALAEANAIAAPEQNLVSASLRALGASNISAYKGLNFLRADVPSAALDALAADPLVAEITLIESKAPALNTSVPAIHASAFYNAPPLGGPVGARVTGAGQSVAVLDTGMPHFHPAFVGLPVTAEAFLKNGKSDKCFADVLNSPFDEVYGHGTEVAGVVAGRAGPYLGAATGLGRLYSVKVFYHTNHRPDCNGGPGEK